MRIETTGVAMPDLDLRAGQRFAVGSVDHAMHDQRLAVDVAAIVQTRKALFDRGACDIKRALDGAGRRVVDAQCRVDEVIQTQTRRDQARLTRNAQIVQPGHTRPILVRRDVQVVDGLEQVGHQPVGDFLHARVSVAIVQAAEFPQKFLNIGPVEYLDSHFFLLDSLWKLGRGGPSADPGVV